MLRLRDLLRSGVDLVLGEESREPPPLPGTLPSVLVPLAQEAVDHLVRYQNAEYAALYLSRLQRFTHRPGIDPTLLMEIARSLAERMRYSDPIWMAQLRLEQGLVRADRSDRREAIRFPLADIVALLPEAAAEGASTALLLLGRSNLRMPMRFTAKTRAGLVKLKAIALLRRLRLQSVRYPKERALVERWLHMIDRSLAKRPEAALEIARTASVIHGAGEVYHRNVATWNVIVDHLVKPALDGAVDVPDLRAAVAALRGAAERGADRQRLLQIVDEIKGVAGKPPAALV
jgi:hypothetical protein